MNVLVVLCREELPLWLRWLVGIVAAGVFVMLVLTARDTWRTR